MAKNRRTPQTEESGERRETESAAESGSEETAAVEPVDADKLDQVTEAHQVGIVSIMGLDTSYFGAKAAEALCEYGAHGDLASLDRAARFIQRERSRVTQ